MKDPLSKVRDAGQDLYFGMVEVGNTPVDGIATPSKLMCCRALRSILPCSQQGLKIKTRAEDIKYLERRQLTHDNKKSTTNRMQNHLVIYILVKGWRC